MRHDTLFEMLPLNSEAEFEAARTPTRNLKPPAALAQRLRAQCVP